MRSFAAKAHNVLSWGMLLGANIVIVLIGLTVFAGMPADAHRGGGFLVGIMALLAVIFSLIARSSARNIWVSILTLVLFVLQPLFAYGEFPIRAMNALHVANGLTIMWLSYALAVGKARATDPKVDKAVTAPATA